MKRWFSRLVCIPAVLAIVLCSMRLYAVEAGSVCMIKVPLDAQVVVRGVALDDKDLVKVEAKTGRIHEIAAVNTGKTCGYKQYMVLSLASPDEVKVYDKDMIPLLPSYAEMGLIEYTDVDANEYSQLVPRIQEAAVAFHNRVGGYGGGNFGSYFQNGSDAYIKMVASDQGKKWGQFVKAPVIVNTTVSDICRYSDTQFTAKVSIHATSGAGYDEIYDVYFLFQHNGQNYYVTHFTYMP